MIAGATGLFSFKQRARGQVFNSKFEISVNDGLRKGWGGGSGQLLVAICMRYPEYKS